MGYLVVISLFHKGDQVTDTLFVDNFPFGRKSHKAFQRAYCFIHCFFVAGHFQLCAPVDDRNAECFLNSADVLIKGAKDRDQILNSLRIYSSFNQFSHNFL